jgi:photosystem II stability/assembly factor-like uncharacterized protein
VSSILSDRTTPDKLYVGVVNDREQGGVFVSVDGGKRWDQSSNGLDGRDVFVLAQAADGSLLAGTNRGIFKLSRTDMVWYSLTNDVEVTAVSTRGRDGRRSAVPTLKVNAIELTTSTWFAATSAGLYLSNDEGRNWRRDATIAPTYIVSVKARNDVIAVATPDKMLVSVNRGKKWTERRLPPYVKGIQNLAFTSDHQIVIASQAGAFRGPKLGAYWQRSTGLPRGILSQVIYDDENHRLLIASADHPAVFGSSDGGHSWEHVAETGYGFREISLFGGRIVGATLFDGVVLEGRAQSDPPAPSEECSPN